MSAARHRPRATTGSRPLRSGSSIEPHRHDDHQIVYASRGVLAVTTDGGSWIAPATRAIWVPAGTVHQHLAHGPTTLHTLGLPVSDNPLSLDEPAVLAVSPLLRELILAYCGTGEPAEEVTGTAERHRLRAVLLDQLRRSPQQPVRLPSPRDPRLVAVCEILHADPAEPGTLAELGARVGASDRTLTRLCRAELGMTFPQWRTQLRLHRALRLLAEELPVTRVAHECGWASTSAFIATFRRAFGRTPGERARPR